MAENKSQSHSNDRCEGRVDTRKTNFQCLNNKDDYLGFVASGGVFLKDFTIEQGIWTWHGICG
ncbi:hypothetical protein [Desulfosarcina ovata]|uniref:Uncharacterized protein n=1 Tax=Desulfosarcina ovata subsp. ovata TaxID=2752305 RepID=A0A5K8A7C4_9BACT|nr:hypothetical protein [Desulfosarcina ovata]BBO88425.1 hypothetical protein DSCOOX_16050 [Desulfosarcina ovata subsp. ovata]